MATTVTRPKPGDWADHKSRGLDPRQVKQVKPFIFEPSRDFPDGLGITIMIRDHETDFIPAANYTYTRDTVSTGG